MNPKLFRQLSIDRLSSPEQLDQMLQVTSLRTWLALLAMLLLLLALVGWGIFGTVVTTTPGTGVIVRQGGVLNVVAHGSGIVLDLFAQPGSGVQASQVVGHIVQPGLAQQLTSLQAAREEALRNRNLTLSVGKLSAGLKVAANGRQRANAERMIAEYKARIALLDQQIAVEEGLLTKGLITKQKVLDLQQQRIEVADSSATAQAQINQLAAEQYAAQHEPEQNDLLMSSRVTEIDRRINLLRSQLATAEQVVTSYAGQVLEVKVLPGSSVMEGQPILSLQPKQQSLQLLAYVPSAMAKDLQRGMEVQISPSNVKREEYGFMRGKVLFVADYPATTAAMMRNFENESLVQRLTSEGVVTEVVVELTGDASTRTRFAWSSSRGPLTAVSAGTLCQVDIVTRHMRPISLLFPYLHRNMGG